MRIRLILRFWILQAVLIVAAAAHATSLNLAAISGAVDGSKSCADVQGQNLKNMVVFGTATAFQNLNKNTFHRNSAKTCLSNISAAIKSIQVDDPDLMDALETRLENALIWLSAQVRQHDRLPPPNPFSVIGIRG